MVAFGILGAAKIAPDGLIKPVEKRNDATIVAVACRDLARGTAVAREHGIPDVLESYEALVAAKGIDAVYNALPPYWHKDLTVRALEAGKHVLCEKPFAMNAREARVMVDAAAANGRVLMEAFHYRFHPAFLAVMDEVRSGAIGRIRNVASLFNVAIADKPGELRHDPLLGGGALMDLGTYPVHMVRTVAGEESEVVAASCEMSPKGVDMTTRASLIFPSGAMATIETSMAAHSTLKTYLRIVGNNGSIAFENCVHPHNGHKITIETQKGHRTVQRTGGTTYECQLAYFLDVIAGKAPLLTGGEDAVAQMAAIDAIYAKAGVARP